MIQVSKTQKEELERVGLLKYKKTGRNPQDQNFIVANRTHKSRDKTYYVVEEQNIMLFLQKYDGLNLQKIRPGQLKYLMDKGLLNESKIQYPHEYKPYAIAFIDDQGQCRIKKVTKLMIELGIWKDNNNN